MLPKAYRLPKEQIQAAFSAGKRFFVPALTLYVLTKDNVPSRFAIIVGKRISPLATKRNRTKRLIRQSLLELTKTLPHPVDMVLVVKKPLFDMKQGEVTRIVKEGFRKANLT